MPGVKIVEKKAKTDYAMSRLVTLQVTFLTCPPSAERKTYEK
jgi:intracellular sulfur oxidation DsrE/DsrF family protein